ncbi:MAG: hydrogenase iron-sulfur subunit [Candidatus Bathyarchaeia archaeon]
MSTKKPSVAVLLCDCGGEISQIIDFEDLQSFVSKLDNVRFVKRHSFLCGNEGEKEVAKVVRKGADRIVVAACSPKLYENHFRNYVAKTKLNPYCLEMANIREQCAWAHADNSKGANEKVKRILKAAVGRVNKIAPIQRKEFKINSKAVLVVGGGVAGLQAAINAADTGYHVYIIEKAPIVGGNATKLGLAFPNDDGAFCISASEILGGIRKCFYRAGILQHPNIELYTLSEVKEFKGSSGDFEAKVLSQPRGVHQSLCINCGKCSKICPIEVADEINYGFSKRKAIYLPHPNAVPPVYVVDWENCTKCGKCVKICPTKAIDLNQKAKETTLKVGSVIIATGFQEYNPSEIKPYKFGVHKDVITQLQLARILDPYGPTEGKLLKPSNCQAPKNVVMIQCVGSRDESTNPYCSKVCCTLALKHAIHIKEQQGRNVEVYICYMDIRTPMDYESYYSRARRMGVKFIRGKPSEISINPKIGHLTVEVEDTLLNMPIEIDADMVVLSTALVPTSGTRKLAEILGVEVGEYGFIKQVYEKLRPVETTVKGIYVCGAAQSPKSIPESVTQSTAAVFRAVQDLSKEKFSKDLDVAYVNEDECDGCEVCIEVCPYSAINMVPVKGNPSTSSVARINEAMCNRCGSCAGRCPTGAIQLSYWNDEQFLSQIGGLLSQEGDSKSPQVVAFCCDECGYATVDLAGMGRISYPANVLPMRVPCLGWVSLYHIFKTFEYGADGILLVGCMFPNCQQLKGNIYADKAVTFARNILDEIGLSSRRLKIMAVCAADPEAFSVEAESFMKELEELGPIASKKGR